MMDLVYILGKGSKWNNNELRYSLRSAEKNFEFGNVFVIGEKPDWLQNVIHIPALDFHNNKIKNAGVKYMIACNTPDISEDFVLMNDDFFFLKRIRKIPYYSRGPTKDVIKSHKSKQGYYFDSIKKTKAKIERDTFIKEPMDFEVHAPIIFNKKQLKEVMENKRDGTVCLYRTYYCNLLGVVSNKIYDFKVTNVSDFNKELEEDRAFMSIGDGIILSEQFRVWLQGKFGEVSKYENDGGAGLSAAPGVSSEYTAYHAKQDFNYGGKQFRKGQLIDMRTIKKLKYTNSLKHLWILK